MLVSIYKKNKKSIGCPDILIVETLLCQLLSQKVSWYWYQDQRCRATRSKDPAPLFRCKQQRRGRGKFLPRNANHSATDKKRGQTAGDTCPARIGGTGEAGATGIRGLRLQGRSIDRLDVSVFRTARIGQAAGILLSIAGHGIDILGLNVFAVAFAEFDQT